MKAVIPSLAAALAATIVLSILMMVKSQMGVMPELNIIRMLAEQMSAGPAMGWAAHFVIGVIGYGLAFALVFRRLPFGNLAVRGVLLGIAGWLVMMVIIMPMMGADLFALSLGLMAPVATLVLHAIFGLVLGLVFGFFTPQAS